MVEVEQMLRLINLLVNSQGWYYKHVQANDNNVFCGYFVGQKVDTASRY